MSTDKKSVQWFDVCRDGTLSKRETAPMNLLDYDKQLLDDDITTAYYNRRTLKHVFVCKAITDNAEDTKEQQQAVCLKCGGSLDYNGDAIREDQQMGYNCECVNCGFVGTEWYHLEFIGYRDAVGSEVK